MGWLISFARRTRTNRMEGYPVAQINKILEQVLFGGARLGERTSWRAQGRAGEKDAQYGDQSSPATKKARSEAGRTLFDRCSSGKTARPGITIV